MISSRVPSPNLMVRLIRTALAALLVSIVAASHPFAQQELTFSLFERYLDALRVQANIPGMSAAIVQDHECRLRVRPAPDEAAGVVKER